MRQRCSRQWARIAGDDLDVVIAFERDLLS